MCSPPEYASHTIEERCDYPSITPTFLNGMSFLSALHLPRRISVYRFGALACLTVVLLTVFSRAQNNYEIQVYGYDLVEPKHANGRTPQ